MEKLSDSLKKIDLLTESAEELSSNETALFYHAVALKLIRRFTLQEVTEIIDAELKDIISEREN